MPSLNKKAVLGIFVLSFAVRLIFFLFAPEFYLKFGDSEEYIEVAQRLCQTGSYPFGHIALPTFRAPGLPIFIALSSGCFLIPAGIFPIILMLLDSVSCLLGMKLVFSISAGSKTIRALLFGIIYSIYPLFIQETAFVQSESLTIFCIISALYLFSDAVLFKKHIVRKAASAGLLISFAVLSRPSSLILFFLIFSATYFGEKTFRKAALISLIFAISGILPWSYYASKQTGQITLVNDSFCYSAYRGASLELLNVYNADSSDTFKQSSEKSEQIIRKAESQIKDNNWCKETLLLLKENPFQEFKLALIKFFVFFRPWPHTGAHNTLIVLGVGSATVFLYICS